jgi:hypothetical protein
MYQVLLAVWLVVLLSFGLALPVLIISLTIGWLAWRWAWLGVSTRLKRTMRENASSLRLCAGIVCMLVLLPLQDMYRRVRVTRLGWCGYVFSRICTETAFVVWALTMAASRAMVKWSKEKLTSKVNRRVCIPCERGGICEMCLREGVRRRAC